MSEQMQIASVALKVTNRNTFDIRDRYDGVPFKFPAGKEGVPCPLDAAIHFFGFKPGSEPGTYVMQADFAYVCKRWGWGTPTRKKDEDMNEAVTRSAEEARKFFDNIEIKAVRREIVETDIEADELPSPRQTAADLAAEDERAPEPEIVGRPPSVPLVRRQRGARETA